jgi:NADPH:quinone reductase-like Zn-dependent oxidoreductase
LRAIACERYGPPEFPRLKEVERPTPKDNEVLVEVHADLVSPFEWHRMRSSLFLVRMGGGLRRPKGVRLGADVAGRVEAVGRVVIRFEPGDEVFGFADGSFAEYVTAAEDELTTKPPNVPFEVAAAAPMTALTALKGLHDQGDVRPGRNVLVNRASGGAGSVAVQIAKSYGAEVTGVSSTRNLELVRSIGADHVIDYSGEDFTRSGPAYDLILDAVGNHSVSQYKRELRPGGTGVVVGFTTMLRLMRVVVRGKVTSKSASGSVRKMTMRPNPEDRATLAELLGSGTVVLLIYRRCPLAEAPDAIRYLEQGHARGKVVIAVRAEPPTG